MGFASIIFDYSEATKYSCILRELLLNIGSLLVYTIFYFKIYSYIINNVPENITFSASTSMRSYAQGESKNAAESSMKVSRFEMSMDVKSGFNFTTTVNNNNDLMKQTNQNKKEIESIANNLFRTQYMEGLKKSFHRIFGFILLLFGVSFVINVSLYLKKGLDDTQMADGLWAKTCESLSFSPVPYAVLLLLLIILFTNVRKLWSLSTMYAETKHICYAIGLWVTLGPLIQLICELMIKQNPDVRLAMMAQSIFLSFFVIDFFLIGLKVIAIIRGGGINIS
ncbi:hypothetical protein PIROE2DRAFT_60737 [Piromyces sp. E2]|nr:hypothetical protein PIROE2DRAFT_60737 [Piromyces sp. E2]|eukprot:OUM64316.1 hypothetical protein PIROE2DRAFT_60737 [Piromyces sp. E2]